MTLSKLALGFLLSTLALGAVGNASVLDWDTVGAWTAGAPTGAGTVSQTFGTGADAVRVSIRNSVTGIDWLAANMVPPNLNNPAAPAIGNNPASDGLPAGSNSGLQLMLENQASASSYVEVTFTFLNPQGVRNVNFNIWDVDRAIDGQQNNATGNTFTDLISNIQATRLGGATTMNPTSIGLGGTSGTDNFQVSTTSVSGTKVTGGSAGGGIENDDINSGQVALSFGTNAITSVTFRWSNPAYDSGLLDWQFIAIGDINFTPVPEVHPGTAALVICGGLAVLRTMRIRQGRKPKLATA